MPKREREPLLHPECGYRYVAKRQAICDADGRSMRGLHPTLTKHFYPKYDYKHAKLRPRRPTKALSVDTDLEAQRKAHGQYAAAPKRRGVLLDGNLGKTIRWFHRHRLPHLAFVNRQITSASVPASVKEGISKISTDLRKLWGLFYRNGWIPLATQVGVGCKRLRLATCVDLVCLDSATKQYVLVELKSGFEGYYENHTRHPMERPFHQQTDCVYNQHQLQLLFTLWMYQGCFPTHQVQKAVIVRAHPRGIDEYLLEPWAVATLPNALESMSSKKH